EAAHPLDDLGAGLKEEVEGVPQHHVVAERRHLGGVERLDRGRRRQRNERGGAHVSVGQTKDARASSARAGADLERAGGHAGQRSPRFARLLRLVSSRCARSRSLDRSWAAVIAAVLAGADLHPPRLALLGLRDAHLEDTLLELGGDAVRVDALGQRQRAAERARRALHAVPAALLALVLGLPLTRDREGVVP